MAIIWSNLLRRTIFRSNKNTRQFNISESRNASLLSRYKVTLLIENANNTIRNSTPTVSRSTVFPGTQFSLKRRLQQMVKFLYNGASEIQTENCEYQS